MISICKLSSLQISNVSATFKETTNKVQESAGLTLFNNYLSSKDPAFSACLTTLRKIILSVIPDAKESFSYQAHCFKHIYMLVGIGVSKESCSLYTMSPPLVKQMKDELKGYEISGATIHFKPAEHLPEKLIKKIVLERIKQNETLVIARKR